MDSKITTTPHHPRYANRCVLYFCSCTHALIAIDSRKVGSGTMIHYEHAMGSCVSWSRERRDI